MTDAERATALAREIEANPSFVGIRVDQTGAIVGVQINPSGLAAIEAALAGARDERKP